MKEDAVERRPKVSIILPTFNRERFIGAAIESVLQQTFEDFELIIVDDGSTDRTPKIVSQYRSEKVKYLWQPNYGRSIARNNGLAAALGAYVSFLDSDDLYLPDKLALEVAFLDTFPEIGMVYTSAYCIDETGNRLEHKYKATASGWIYNEIAFFLPVTVTLPTVMARREVFDRVGGFDESMERFEDTDMWRRIAKEYQIGALSEYTCLLRTHSNNALFAQDPAKLASAVDYYVSKVFEEDRSVKDIIKRTGAYRLYEYYGRALMGVRKWRRTGRRLISKASEYFCPKVSIIIPVLNGADYLSEAVESALRQTYNNLEVIVVDDGSEDQGATEAVAKSFGDKIRYVFQENGGVAAALNRGVKEMTGEYFSWLSHDDVYCPNKIEAQIRELAAVVDPEHTILYSDYGVFSGTSSLAVPVKLPSVSPEDFRYFITTNNVLHGCTLLVPKAAFEKYGLFDKRLRTTQDYDLWFRLAARYKFVHIAAMLVKARSHENQGTVRMKDTVLEECNALLAGFVARMSEAELTRGSGKALGPAYLEVASNLRKRGFEIAAQEAEELAKRKAEGISTIAEALALLGVAYCELGNAYLQRYSDAEAISGLQRELEKLQAARTGRAEYFLRGGKRVLRLLVNRFREGRKFRRS